MTVLTTHFEVATGTGAVKTADSFAGCEQHHQPASHGNFGLIQCCHLPRSVGSEIAQ